MAQFDLSQIPAGILPGTGQGQKKDQNASKKKGKSFKPKPRRNMRLQRLRSRHHRIIEMAATGKYTNKEIADHFNVHPATVSNTLNSHWAKLKLARMNGKFEEAVIEVGEAIQELAVDALGVMEELLYESTNDSVRHKAAKDILEMSGHGGVKKHDFTVRPGAPEEDIEDIKKRALEQRRERLRARRKEDGEILIEAGPKPEAEA